LFIKKNFKLKKVKFKVFVNNFERQSLSFVVKYWFVDVKYWFANCH